MTARLQPALRLPRMLVSWRPQPPRRYHAAVKPLARAAQGSPPQPRRVHSAAEEFFAKRADNFASLGLDASLCAALEASGFSRPAHVQVWRPRGPAPAR